MSLSATTELCHEPHHDLYCTVRNLYQICWDRVTIYPCGLNLALNFEQAFPNKYFWLNKFSKYFWLKQTCIPRLWSQLSISCGQKCELMALTVMKSMYILVYWLGGCKERATPVFFHHCSLTENSRLLDAWETLARIDEEGGCCLRDRSGVFLSEFNILYSRTIFVHPEWNWGFWSVRRRFPGIAVTLTGENHSGWAWFHFSPAVCSHVVCACSNDRIWSHSNLCCGQFVAVEAIHFRGEKDQKLLQVLCSLWWEAWEGEMAVMPQSNRACVVEAVTSGWASGNYHSNLTYTKTSCSCCESALKIILLNSRTGLERFWSLIPWRRFHSS